MSGPLRPTLLPQCTSCIRRTTRLGLQEWRPSQHQQVRGKKKLANIPNSVTVRLLKDVQTFGRKGAFVPISIGQMRNEWFPRRTAEYVTASQMKDLKTRNITPERDFQFGVIEATAAGQSDKAAELRAQLTAQKSARPGARSIEVEKLTPERATQLLEILVPPRLDFHRQLIETTPAPTPAPESAQHQKARQRSASNAAMDLLAARSQAPKIPAAPAAAASAIYGSVSTADIANNIKALIAENDEAAKIVFAEEDVAFVNLAGQPVAEADKLKYVGEYGVEIKIKGADAAVTKTVRVLPQE